ncbi:MAG: hypothetical protein ACJAT7_001204 [Psychromonas sp.]|jgi:uncharacterized protein (DUF342 family)|uniref:DUF342 domain-containing protein n=1 Tax=Psychromonas sp. TaxID=1884585 RepID=UPI0039E3BEFE
MKNNQPLSTNLLRLSPDKQQLLVLITPVQDDVSVDSLSRIFQQSDYSQLKLNISGVNQAIQSFQRLEYESERSAELESVAIADRLDAQLSITLDPLKMVAKAHIISAYGGLPVTAEQLKNEMDKLEIKHGINHKALTLLIDKSQQAKPGSIYQVTIAKGKQPVNGTDASFKRLVETPRERLFKPQQIEDGRVDMRNLGQLITVKPGDQLMRKIPHSEGFAGIDVTGAIVKHTSGKDFSLEAGTNTEVCSTDPNLLIASIPGIPKALNNGMVVDDVLMVKNVDVTYGNVNYEGSVIVEGDICDGMKVSATGDVTVSGFIESAHVDCGGDLIVGKGILGHQVELGGGNFSCDIDCKGAVIANFSQYSKINAGLDVNIQKQLSHCYVFAGGNINVKDDAGNKGVILGGFLSTNKGVNTVTLGASAGSKTTIDLTGLYPELMAAKKRINSDIVQEQEKLQSLIVAQRKIDCLPASEKKQMLDARLMLTKEAVKIQLALLQTELENNTAELQLYFENAKVITQKELYSDVSITIGRDSFRSARTYGPTKVSVKNYKLLAEPYLK